MIKQGAPNLRRSIAYGFLHTHYLDTMKVMCKCSSNTALATVYIKLGNNVWWLISRFIKASPSPATEGSDQEVEYATLTMRVFCAHNILRISNRDLSGEYVNLTIYFYSSKSQTSQFGHAESRAVVLRR